MLAGTVVPLTWAHAPGPVLARAVWLLVAAVDVRGAPGATMRQFLRAAAERPHSESHLPVLVQDGHGGEVSCNQGYDAQLIYSFFCFMTRMPMDRPCLARAIELSGHSFEHSLKS